MKYPTERIEELADNLAGNVRGWERSVLEKIAKRVRLIGELSPADVKQLNNAADITGDLDSIFSDLAKMTGENVIGIKEMYERSLSEIHKVNEPLFDYRNKAFIPLEDNIELQSLVSAFAKSTAGDMLNLSKTSTMCLSLNGDIVSLKDGYTNIIDKAIMQVKSGAGDFNTAMRDTIKALGGSGIRVNYESGITRRLDTAVRQNILWGVKQATGEYNNRIGEEIGCDGIEIDWHSNPRPSHEFMQGKQFHIGGDTVINGEFYPDSTEAEERLEDYNCYHFATPIICGVSEPTYTNEELERLNKDNDREYNIDGVKKNGYGWSQDMRKLESYHRTQQDIRAVAKASGDKELVKECDRNIFACLKKYNKISEITGIPIDSKRLASVIIKR